MALSESDQQAIARLIAEEVKKLRQELKQSGNEASGGEAREAAVSRAVAPMTRMTGSWKLSSTGSGGTEAGALDAPVEFDRFESELKAGGKVLITQFTGRMQRGVEAGGQRLQQRERFGGVLVLAYDPNIDQYIELYADDHGKVALSTSERWEAEGDVLRLYHPDYIAEYANRGSSDFRFNLYERNGSGSTEAAGATLKSATLTRQ
jgi:hypothetical protein